MDHIEQSYCLEVSSAGIERETCKGQQIVVRLIRPYNGVREFVGTLLKLEDATVYLSAEDGEYAFRLNDIAVVRLYAVF